MNQNIVKNNNQDEVSFYKMMVQIKDYYHYLLSKWVIIVIFGLSSALIGFGLSFVLKPKYTAHLSFALIEKTSGGGGLIDLASSFGLGGLLSGGGNGAFSGDNLLEILKSQHAIQKTLLTPVDYNGKKQTLSDIYIDINNYRDAWKKKPLLKDLNFPVGQERSTFSREQDSILYIFYFKILNGGDLQIARKDKKISIVNIDFKSKDEQFSKLFVQSLMAQTYEFYKETKTAQSRQNINIMEAKADSVKQLYEAALYQGARISQVNINKALQIAAVPRIKQESNAQLYGTVYAEILKNLETLKLDLARETPIVQLIDEPIYPLKVEKLGKLKGIVLGGFLGGFLIVIYLIVRRYFKSLVKNEQ